jgi:hypothetical protein
MTTKQTDMRQQEFRMTLIRDSFDNVGKRQKKKCKGVAGRELKCKREKSSES